MNRNRSVREQGDNVDKCDVKRSEQAVRRESRIRDSTIRNTRNKNLIKSELKFASGVCFPIVNTRLNHQDTRTCLYFKG